MDFYRITLTGPNVPVKTEIVKSESKQIVESVMRGGMASKTGEYYGYTIAKFDLIDKDSFRYNIPEIMQIEFELNESKTSDKVKQANIKQLGIWIGKNKSEIGKNKSKIEKFEKLISLQIIDISKIRHDKKCTKKIVEQEKSGHTCGYHYTCLVCDKVHVKEVKLR